ncbi:G-type lectin S-receptor-like serine/threonine-protein kinase, partial [Tanacetum coccineum]
MDSDLTLTSWKSVNDPSPGSFVFQKLESGQYVIWNTEKLTTRWKSGFGSMENFEPNQVYIDVYNLLTNFTTQTKDKNNCILKNSTSHNNVSIQCSDTLNTNNSVVFNDHSRLLIGYAGSVKYFSWAQSQNPDWEEPENECRVYGVCGKFAMCYVSNQSTTCNCLDRFQRVDPGVASYDCKPTSDICRPEDVFINVSMINVENPSRPFLELENRTYCEKGCLQTCECKAYSFSPAIKELTRSGRIEGKNRCWMWDTELINLQANGTHNI